MPRTAMMAAALAATACSSAAPPPEPVSHTRCYFLEYSDPVAGADPSLFPAWVELLGGPKRGAVESRSRPEHRDGFWQRLAPAATWARHDDGLRIAATDGFARARMDLRRDDGALTGTATFVTDEIGLPGPATAMQVTAHPAACAEAAAVKEE